MPTLTRPMTRFASILAASLLLPSALLAQSAVVEIDHATGNARLIVTRGSSADTTSLGKHPVVRLPRTVPVEVRVVNTNTAFYQFAAASEVTPLPEMTAVRSFGSRLGPYIPEITAALKRGVKSRGEGEAPTAESIEAARVALSSALAGTQGSLARLDNALYGSGGVQANLTSSLLALERMRMGEAPESASAPLRTALSLGAPCRPEAPVRLPAAQNVLGALSDLVDANATLQAAAGAALGFTDPGIVALRDSADRIRQRAATALNDFEPLVDNAYRVERLVGAVASACSHWSAGEASGTRTTGQKITVTVEPRGEPELARLADRGASTYVVSVQPQALIRPALGFGGVASPTARFSTYDTRTVSNGELVVENGHVDRRFGLAATLGLTWPGLDQRDTHGVAVWLPEIVVSTSSAPALGVGTAVSWNFLKLGVGALWVRHPALEEGQVAGQLLAPGSVVKMGEAYGPPRAYISLSVFDWAPFADRLSRD